RRGRRRTTAHRGGPQCERCGTQSDAGTIRTGHWHRARSVVRLCANRFYSRYYGTTLSAVRRDDRDLYAPLSLQRPHLESGARGAAAAAQDGKSWTAAEI